MRHWYIIVALSLNVLPFGLKAQQVPELGDVKWLRNYDEAREQARRLEKPIFLLFQEVPGCNTCQKYGKQVLQHPLLVEAIEDLFVPLAIYNNKAGHDEKVLKFYGEPAWNNPVSHIIDSEGKDVISRLSGQYSPYDVAVYIQEALIAWKTPIPPYLSLLAEELAAEHLGAKDTYLSMSCFWSGEKHLGQINGVVSTEAGFMDGKEVIKLRYVPDLLSYEDLVDKAQSVNCASAAYTDDSDELKQATSLFQSTEIQSTSSYQKDREDKYYLRKSDLQYIPLTKLQKTRFNSMIGQGLNPSHMLSPRQHRYLQKLNLSTAKSQINVPLTSFSQLQ